jgi:phage tail protein X
MQYVEYVTKEGDRWDQIALIHYGNAYDYERIIIANPTAPITPTLPGGIKLAIPVIERQTANSSLLPPWKR